MESRRKALIVHGGWDGHEPRQVSEIFKNVLEAENFEVEVSETLDSFLDVEKLKQLHLIIPVYTMSKITNEQCLPVLEAVASGVGIAGCHGGMCDAFRENCDWQFMTGSQWVAHPGGSGVTYRVNVTNNSSVLTDGISDFDIMTEQYYIHVDPCVEVLATTDFPTYKGYHMSNKKATVPVVYTKRWGHGRVFYNALGHVAKVFDTKEALEFMRRGFLWAAEGKDIAVRDGLDSVIFRETPESRGW